MIDKKYFLNQKCGQNKQYKCQIYINDNERVNKSKMKEFQLTSFNFYLKILEKFI